MTCFAGSTNGTSVLNTRPIISSRGAAIRTRDLLNPIQVRYRAALRPADNDPIVPNRRETCKPPGMFRSYFLNMLLSENRFTCRFISAIDSVSGIPFGHTRTQF